MKKTINIYLVVFLMLMSVTSHAQLPSWGMTENQYKLPNFAEKMGEIGSQAYKNNWLLKITAPEDWHHKIRVALTNTGARDVQVTFKDSLYNSIAISAVKGAKIAKISSSSNNATVQKQVVIDKPEIDTEIEAPDFGDTDFNNNSKDLLENIAGMEISVPNATGNVAEVIVDEVVETVQTETKEVAETVNSVDSKIQEVVEVVVEPNPEALIDAVAVESAPQSAENTEANKEFLRKKHARTKRVDKRLTYNQINNKDEMFIKGSVVLIKRFFNKGVVLFYWMKEPYDPEIHKLVNKGSGKFRKDAEATEGSTPAAEEAVIETQVTETKLGFVAVDSAVEDQNDLRRDYVRNKRVDNNITVNRLKKGDVLYVQNQTVLVVREIAKSQNIYMWLVGETTIDREVARKGDNKFIIK